MRTPTCFTCSCAECRADTRRWLQWMIVIGFFLGLATGLVLATNLFWS